MIDLRPTILPVLLIAAMAGLALPAGARPPLSASDWLSGSLRQPENQSAWRPGDSRPPDARQGAPAAPIASSGSVEPVGVRRLGHGNPDATGTVSPRAAGLPADLWGESDSMELARQVQRLNPQLPTLRRLLRRVLAARLEPPMTLEPGHEGALFLARVDKLLDLGATGAAQDLLHAAGPGDSERFRRLFDIALLSGDESRACQIMDETPGIAPSFAARIFCLAMGGDWAAAALVYVGADILEGIDPQSAQLMSHYLDDTYVDSAETLPVPATITPLDFRLYEAIGQPLSSAHLPLAFALSDLDDNGGWKARLDAAERLARVGAIPTTQLRDIYLQQEPAASGGVWDRAAAMQNLVNGLVLDDRIAVEKALPAAYKQMNRAGLGHALADMVGAELAALDLSGQAGNIAIWLALAAGQPQAIATVPQDAAPFDRWLIGFARGDDSQPPPADSETAHILSDTFQGDPARSLPDAAGRLIAENRRGEALFDAITDTDTGLEGNFVRAAGGLQVLLALGQGEIARQAAVELMLTPRVSGLR